MNRTHILDAGQRWDGALVDDMRGRAEAAVTAATTDLGLDGVDVVVCRYAGLAIPGIGVGGYCPSAELVLISLDPADPGFVGDDEESPAWHRTLPSTIAHELHHAKRWSGPGYGPRLVDSLVSEGAATLYEIELSGITPPYARELDDPSGAWRQARPLLGDTDQHARWFFGSADLPRWTGYALGTAMARAYASHTGASARELATIPADDVAASVDAII